jgi:hypothetical protein
MLLGKPGFRDKRSDKKYRTIVDKLFHKVLSKIVAQIYDVKYLTLQRT